MNCLNRFARAFFALGAALTSFAGTFTSDFNSSTAAPAGTALNGASVIEAAGGVNNSGVLKLTKAVNDQSGSFVIGDLDGGNPVYGFDLTAKVRLGGGTATPADGFSINFDPLAGLESVTGEEGTSGGITFAFDIYDNTNENPPAPSIDLKVQGALIATHKMSIADFDTGAGFADLHIRIAPDGAASLAFKGNVLFTNIYFTAYEPYSGASFVLGARTGGLNQNQWIDDLAITTYTQPQVGISLQPRSQTVLAGSDVTLTAAANNAAEATFQWLRNGVEVAGATSASLVLDNVAAADDGARYSVRVTGPNNTVTSQEAVLSVKVIALPGAPALSLDFNDGTLPAGAFLAGDAVIAAGLEDPGVVQLTYDAPGLAGALIINDLSSGAAVYGVTAEFDVLARSLGAPADGFSFSFASDIPDDPVTSPPRGLEEGIGSGLVVAFDIYDNGGGEAPAIDVIYNNQVVASAKLPISAIMTGDAFAHAIIHLANDGTIDVVYKGEIIHDNVLVPGFTSVSGGRFAFAARTGGLSADQWIDNVRITPNTTAGEVRFATQPAAQTVLIGRSATFAAAVNDPDGVTYQWFRNGAAIGGADGPVLTTPATAAADNGALFRVEARRGGIVVTSDEASLTVVSLAVPTNPALSFDFENGQIPAGASVYGGGAGLDGGDWLPRVEGGALTLTEAANGQAGAFVINPLLEGAEVSALNVAFDLRIGGGTTPPADGLSFNFGSDLPSGTVGEGENGAGSGLTLGFDIYDNGGGEAPAVELRWGPNRPVIASRLMTTAEIQTGDDFRTVLLRITPDGKVDAAYGEVVLFSGVQLPNYTPVSNGRVGFYARTGGLNANQSLDNIRIDAVKSTAPLRITQEPADVAILTGQTATLTVAVSDPAGATYQWSRNGTAIEGATSAAYTTPALAAGGSGRYTVRVTGPGGTAESREASVTVVPPLTLTNPDFALDFNDGSYPENVFLTGTAYIPDGALHLTDAVNSQGGSIVITGLGDGAVSGFTLHARVLVGGGTTPPADGFSIVWGNDVPTTTSFGEDGAGGGLVLSFDIFDNGNETPPAPSIDARWAGQLAGTVKLSYQEMRTGEEWADLYIRVEADGTLDVQYKNRVIFHNLPLPGFAPLTGAAFGIGARTGGLNENQWFDDLAIVTGGGVAPPQINISKAANGALFVTWDGPGTLEARDSLDAGSPWTPVIGAGSPHPVSNDRALRFFRIAR